MAAQDRTPQPARRSAERQRRQQRADNGRGQPTYRTATVDLPFVRAEFQLPEAWMPEHWMPQGWVPELRMPELRMPDVTQAEVPGLSRDELNGAVALVRSYLPPPQQAAYYACLGVLGALQMVEWPVVLAIGAGTAISRQSNTVQQGGGAQQNGGREAPSEGWAGSGTSTGSTSQSR